MWCIYYGDGSTFSDEDGTPKEAPPWDIQVIAESNERVGKLMHIREDYYIYDKNHWIGVDFVGMIDYVANVLGIVKIGRMIDSPTFKEIYKKAMENERLAKKSAWEYKEKRVE